MVLSYIGGNVVMKKLKQWLIILIILTVIVGLVYTAYGIMKNLTTFTSFPWWSAVVYALIYFVPILLIEFGVLILINLYERR